MVKTWTYKELDEKYGKLCKRYNSVCYDKQRLKAQLDREIKINRKMKRVLEKYVLPENYEGGMGREYENMCIECKEVLKEVEEV